VGAATVVATLLFAPTIHAARGPGRAAIRITSPLPFSTQPAVTSFATSGDQATSVAAMANAVVTAATPAPPPAPAPAPAPAPTRATTHLPASTVPAGLPLVRKSQLVYEGAFRPPKGNTAGPISFDAVKKTLLLVDTAKNVSEISIPAPVVASDLAALPTATVIQPAADITDGKMKTIDGDVTNGVNVGGIFRYKNTLYTTVYSYYDGLGKQTLSHFTSGLSLATTNDAQGPYRVEAPKAGYVSGYMGAIPLAWQAALGGPVLNGNCCLSIISRTSYGPAAFALDPSNIGASAAAAAPLLYYTSTDPLDAFNTQNLYFNGSSSVVGVAFPENTRSVLFFGRHGVGPFCYGTGSSCGDPTNMYQGNHAYPYKYYVWAYDAADLALVRSGKLSPWTVTPYEIWTLDPTFAQPSARVWGATFDPATGRVFVNQGTDTSWSVIQVYRIMP
jgi:hypothetical protein